MEYIGRISMGPRARMFRRFMIVCWVLFLLLGCTSLIGVLGSTHYRDLSKEIVSESNRVLEQKLESGEYSPDNPYMTLPKEWTPESRVADRRTENFTIVTLISSAAALLVLLWNILWHTGHWIWMGRDKK